MRKGSCGIQPSFKTPRIMHTVTIAIINFYPVLVHERRLVKALLYVAALVMTRHKQQGSNSERHCNNLSGTVSVVAATEESGEVETSCPLSPQSNRLHLMYAWV